MRVQEIASASCAKMTEEKNLNGSSKLPSGSKKPFGINSDELKNAASLEVDRSCSIAGGRLKFFKGKFFQLLFMKIKMVFYQKQQTFNLLRLN